jgi:hypothetical protein
MIQPMISRISAPRMFGMAPKKRAIPALKPVIRPAVQSVTVLTFIELLLVSHSA